MDGVWPKRLELRQLIGRGWLGDVYLAQDLDSPRQVATRVLNEQHTANVGLIANLLQFGASRQHPHVLPTTLPEQHEDNVFYTMPLAESGSLRTLLDRQHSAGTRLDPISLLDLVRQAGEALAFAHAQGVIHGNLKPENMLLQPGRTVLGREGYDVLLSDFGLNTLRPPDPASPYLNADQRQGQAANVQSDIYVLGAILFEGLGGRSLPLDPKPEDLESVPESLRKLLGRALGWPLPFADMATFLGLLRAQQLVMESGAVRESLQLSAESATTDVIPGEEQVVNLRLSAGNQPAAVQFQVEGIPESWVESLPVVQLPAKADAVVPLKLNVPRLFTTSPKTYELNILALYPTAEPTEERLLLAQVPLLLRVLPFEDSRLQLTAPKTKVGSSAALQLKLQNEGNQPQQYNLDITLPRGASATHGTLRRQFELPPGGEYNDALEVRLPLSLLAQRTHNVIAVTHSLARGTIHEGATWPPPHATLEAAAQVQQRPLLPWWAALLLLGGLLGGGVWAAQPPQISQFRVVGEQPMRGEPFTLAWKTTGARDVHILELPHQKLNSQGQLQVPGLSSEQTYTLVARGLLTQRREQVTIKPLAPAPKIDSFKVTPPTAAVGQTVQVSWNVLNAPNVQLSPFGAVPAQGSRAFKLTKDTRFQLVARKGTVPSPQDVQSVVTATLSAPQIETFSVTPSRVQRGQNVTVTWKVNGASQVRLAPLGTLPASGTKTFAPIQTGNLTLKASNGQQEVTSSAALTVSTPQAQIAGFTITPASPTIGEPLKVQWRTANADQVELRWGNQRQILPASGQLSLVTTAQMQSMSLFAQNQNSEPVLLTRRLTLLTPPAPAPVVITPPAVTPTPTPTPAPNPSTPTPATPPQPAAPQPTPQPPVAAKPTVRILNFQANAKRLTLGQPLTLSWQVRGDTRVRITGQNGLLIGQFPARGSTRFITKRAGLQTYTLTSTQDSRQRATVVVQVDRPAVPVPTPPKPAPTPAPKPNNTAPNTVSPASTPVAVDISEFTAKPAALRAGQTATLSWKVSGVNKVFIVGLRGPNSDGSFAPTASVTTPVAQATQVFVLSAGGTKKTLRVPLLGVAPTNRPPANPTPSQAPTTHQYDALDGAWNHSYGQMNLKVNGNRVSGSLTSSRPDLPSGPLSGRLTGGPDSPVMTGFVGEGEGRIALIMRFDPAQADFDGFYSSRSARQRWCGWQGSRPDNC